MSKPISARKGKKTTLMFLPSGAGKGLPVPPFELKGPRVRFGRPLPFPNDQKFLEAGFAEAASAILKLGASR